MRGGVAGDVEPDLDAGGAGVEGGGEDLGEGVEHLAPGAGQGGGGGAGGQGQGGGRRRRAGARGRGGGRRAPRAGGRTGGWWWGGCPGPGRCPPPPAGRPAPPDRPLGGWSVRRSVRRGERARSCVPRRAVARV